MSSYETLQRQPNRRRHRTQGVTQGKSAMVDHLIRYSEDSACGPEVPFRLLEYHPSHSQSSDYIRQDQSSDDAWVNPARSRLLQYHTLPNQPGHFISSHRTTPSVTSTNTAGTSHTNALFFATNQTPGATAKSHTWKSDKLKQHQRFIRMLRLVGFVAPEQFRDHAHPTGGPCDIVPNTFQQFCEHEKQLVKMREVTTRKNVDGMKAQIATRQASGVIKSAFGENGKIYGSMYSPVLCRVTIWSAEYEHAGLPLANWPSHSELRFYGDTRVQSTSRCGRFLPPPRFPSHDSSAYHTQPLLPIQPLDQTGPLYTGGPSPIEVLNENKKMDGDDDFEAVCMQMLDRGVLDEAGIRPA